MTLLARRLAAAALLLAPLAFAQQPPAKPTEAKPAEVKPTEVKPAEPTDIKAFTFATDAEFADMTQQFNTLYAKTAKSAAGQPAKSPKTTTVSRAKTVLVRGTKAELEAAEAVVKLIQGTAADAKGPQLAKLKAARADEVVSALAALELDGFVLPLRSGNALILLPAPDATAQQVKKVIDTFEKIDPKAGTKVNAATNNDG